MNRAYYIILICFFVTCTCFGQSFEKIIATPNDESPSCTLEDSNFYFVTGIKGNFLSGQYSGIVYKLSKAGDTLKTITISDCILRFIKSNSGHYFIGGDKIDSNNLQSNYLAEIDTGLNLIWEKNYSIGQPSTLGDLVFLNGEIYCSGYIYATQVEFIYKFNLYGDSLNNVILPSQFYGYANSLSSNQNNKLVLASSYAPPAIYFCFAILDTALNIVDSAYNSYLFFNYSLKCRGNDYYVSGMAFDSSYYLPTSEGFYGHIGARLCKFDSSFQLTNYIDLNTLSNMEYSATRGFDFNSNGDIYLAYSTNCDSNNFFFSNNFSQYSLVCLDSNFNIKYQKFFGVKFNFALTVQATNDGGCLLSGTRYDNSNPFGQQRDIYIVKTDSLGNVSTGFNENIVFYDFMIYPNPVSHENFWIQSGKKFEDVKSVQATDMLGRKTILKFTKEDTKINVVHSLSSGLYNITIITKENITESHRLIVH